MLPTTPRRPASAGPTGRNVISPQSLNRELPQLPPLGAPIQLDKHIESNNSPATGPEAKRAVLLDVVLERDEDGGVSEGQTSSGLKGGSKIEELTLDRIYSRRKHNQAARNSLKCISIRSQCHC
jgi:hypothetical protein